MRSGTVWAAIAPLVVLAVTFAVYCVVDLIRRPDVRVLPRWAWAVLCCLVIPWGGIAYLLVGRSER